MDTMVRSQIDNSKLSVGVPVNSTRINIQPVGATIAIPVSLVTPAPIQYSDVDEQVATEWIGALSPRGQRSTELVVLARQINAQQDRNDTEYAARARRQCKICIGSCLLCTGSAFLLYSLVASAARAKEGTTSNTWMPITGIMCIFIGAFLLVLAGERTPQ